MQPFLQSSESLATNSRLVVDQNDTEEFYNIAHVGDSKTFANSADFKLSGKEESLEAIPINDTRSDVSSKSDTGRYSKYGRIIIVVSVISALLILAFQSYMFAVMNLHKDSIHSNPRYIEMSVFFSLFVFASVFQIIVTFLGVFTHDLLILTGMIIFYGCMLIYSGIQYNEVIQIVAANLEPRWKHSTKGTNIATIAIIGVTFIIETYFTFFMAQKYIKWFSFKQVGADLRMRRMYMIFQVHRVCLLFDFFFFLGFTIQFIVIMVKDKTSPEFIVTVCILPLTLILLFLADLATTREWLWLSLFTVVLFCGGIFYVLFKTVRLFTHYSSAYGLSFETGGYFPGRKSLVTFAVFALILLISTLIFEIYLIFQYGRGLKSVVGKYYSWIFGCSNKETEKNNIPQHEEASFVID